MQNKQGKGNMAQQLPLSPGSKESSNLTPGFVGAEPGGLKALSKNLDPGCINFHQGSCE